MNRILWIILGTLMLASVHAASFDCTKADAHIEKIICGNFKLSMLDDALSNAYRQSLERGDNKQELIQEQRNWLKKVRDVCHDEDCLIAAYEARIDELSAHKLPLRDSLDKRVCTEVARLLVLDDAHRPFDNSSYSKAGQRPMPDGSYKERFVNIAVNEYNYTEVARSNSPSLKGFAIIYVEKFEGDRSPRLVETWKVDSNALSRVLELPPGPIPYSTQKIPVHSEDTNATEFAELLNRGEKVSEEWSPVIEVFGEPYLVERSCDGGWAFGGFYGCNKVIELTVKKLSRDEKAIPYCKFAEPNNR